MAMVTIARETFALAHRMRQTLLNEIDNPVQQQLVIEMLLAWHAAEMDNKRDAHKVVDGVAKHAKQFMERLVTL